MASEVNRRTTDGGRKSSFRSVITGLLLTQPLLAASGTFDGRCQPEAAPNTYPRVGHRVTQHDATTAGSPRALETRPFPRAGQSIGWASARRRSQFIPGSAGGQPQAMAPKHPN